MLKPQSLRVGRDRGNWGNWAGGNLYTHATSIEKKPRDEDNAVMFGSLPVIKPSQLSILLWNLKNGFVLVIYYARTNDFSLMRAIVMEL
jgi:hypothetical protein